MKIDLKLTRYITESLGSGKVQVTRSIITFPTYIVESHSDIDDIKNMLQPHFGTSTNNAIQMIKNEFDYHIADGRENHFSKEFYL